MVQLKKHYIHIRMSEPEKELSNSRLVLPVVIMNHITQSALLSENQTFGPFATSEWP